MAGCVGHRLAHIYSDVVKATLRKPSIFFLLGQTHIPVHNIVHIYIVIFCIKKMDNNKCVQIIALNTNNPFVQPC